MSGETRLFCVDERFKDENFIIEKEEYYNHMENHVNKSYIEEP